MDQTAPPPALIEQRKTKPMSSRRSLLKGLVKGLGLTAVAAVSGAGAGPSLAHSVALAPTQKRRIKLYNTHTRESLDVVYRIDDNYVESNLTKLYFLLRDHRQNEAIVMDENLFDKLWNLQQLLGDGSAYDVISGYRSPETNAMLRQRSSKVAVNSYHMKGRAIDIRLRNVPLKSLHQAALSLNSGGVGFYPSSQFIHLDTGPSRNWMS